MKRKRFAFVMDPLRKLDLPWDTSLCLVRSLARAGHESYLFTLSSLSSESGRVLGMGRLIKPLGNNRYCTGPDRKFSLGDFDAVLIRKDPPFDASYLALTYLLEPVACETRVINHPRGIRNANEKLFGLRWSRWSPPTLVSSNGEEILAFQKRVDSDVVVKPLYEKGGKGIFLLRRGEKKRLRSLKEPVVVQKFIPLSKEKGDKRILIWKGEILGGFERIPRAGEFRSNLSLGGQFRKCRITEKEKRLVRDLRPTLREEGLLFVGIDVRCGFLIEVNVTSPAGLVELNQLDGGATSKITRDLITLNIPGAPGQRS